VLSGPPTLQRQPESFDLPRLPIYYGVVNLGSWQFTSSAAWYYFTTAADGDLSLH
jgi:hypothetical protein